MPKSQRAGEPATGPVEEPATRPAAQPTTAPSTAPSTKAGTKAGTKVDTKAGTEPAAEAAGRQHPEGRPRRRQARGERRIAQLLDAAAAVFCRTGYTAASTNAIAREAGVSPGTLYQFFPNKEAIAISLGDQLLRQWQESQGRALAGENIGLPLKEMLDAALDPLIAFNVENPAFGVLLHGPDTPGPIAQECNAVHDASLTRIEEMIAGYLPDGPPDERTRTANMLLALFKAGLDLIMTHEGAERQAYITELKTAMYRYLKPLLDGDASAG